MLWKEGSTRISNGAPDASACKRVLLHCFHEKSWVDLGLTPSYDKSMGSKACKAQGLALALQEFVGLTSLAKKET